jgi:hypothetical protein
MAMGLINKMREPSTPTPPPVSSQQFQDPVPANPANVAGTFRGMTFNTTRHKGASSLLLVQQEGNLISGCFVVAPPMQGSGPIKGQVRENNVVLFNANSPSNSMLFAGELVSGTLKGSLYIWDTVNASQSGVFSLTRQTGPQKPIPDRCPSDKDRAVAKGKLTMPYQSDDPKGARAASPAQHPS